MSDHSDRREAGNAPRVLTLEASPEAVARCPSPIHMPSIRSGKTTIER